MIAIAERVKAWKLPKGVCSDLPWPDAAPA